MFVFTPDIQDNTIDIPFFENARADFAPYYAVRKTTTLKSAESQVAEELAKLGGYVTGFHRGIYQIDAMERYGYEIRFMHGGTSGIIRIAGLPIHSKTEKKIELLKEKRTSLINHCVTKGLNPNVEMKDSGVEWIGEIPSHWILKPLFTQCYHTKLVTTVDKARITDVEHVPMFSF